MKEEPEFIINNDEMTRRCNRLNARLKADNPAFDSKQMINELINMGDLKFGYDDEDVKYLRETVLELDKKKKTDRLTIYTIYDNPLDYPGYFVVRKWKIVGYVATPIRDGILGISKTLEGARKLLPEGCALLPRDESDEPQIVESWL
jgi:hypothetical protein